jgi:hypothetical protein
MPSDPAEILSYLRKHAKDWPQGIRVDDLNDAVVLHQWLWWEHAARELWLFDQAATLNAERRSFATLFGIASGAGFNNRRDRLRSLLAEHGTGRPDEKAAMQDRAATAGGPDEIPTWKRARMKRAAQLAGPLRSLADDETAEALSEVLIEQEKGSWGDTTRAVLVMAAMYVQDCDELDGNADAALFVSLVADLRSAAKESPSTI